jgi:hypothetical protein
MREKYLEIQDYSADYTAWTTNNQYLYPLTQAQSEEDALILQEEWLAFADKRLEEIDETLHDADIKLQPAYAAAVASAGITGKANEKDRKWAADSAAAAATFNLLIQSQSNLAAYYSNRAALLASTQLKKAAEAKKKFVEQDSTLKQDSRRRKEAEAGKGFAFDIEPRLIGLVLRFRNDLEQSYARLVAASIGLRDIYAFDLKNHPVPELLQHDTSNAPGPGSTLNDDAFDLCVVWVRNAISWLVRITRRDQPIIVTVSVQRLLDLNANAWSASLAQTGTLQWTIGPITPALVGIPPEYTLFRLRGITLSLIPIDSSKQDVDVWRGLVALPSTQQPLTCYAGRVEFRHPVRQPDILGATLLHNLSPFDRTWTIQMSERSLGGQKMVNSVGDIWLDLHLVAQGEPQ